MDMDNQLTLAKNLAVGLGSDENAEEPEIVLPDGGTGVEVENEEEDSDQVMPIAVDAPDLNELFNPVAIRVSNKLYSLDSILARIANNEIDLQPGFQRKPGIWSAGTKSRLIESLLVRIPLPAFYLDATNEDKWLVIDGLQRLTTLKEFVLDQTLKLQDLEIMHELAGKRYCDLSRTYQRRIRETQLTVVQIEAGTPKEAIFAIFRRINTGGLPLSSQEIRHALYQGRATDFLANLAMSDEFKMATNRSIRDDRMADREFILRFVSFVIEPYSQYQFEDLDGFLNKQMEVLNGMTKEKIDELEKRFKRAMRLAHAIFGKYAFRKVMPTDRGLNPVNRALFEVWSVTLDQLPDSEAMRLVELKDKVRQEFSKLMQEEEFYKSISVATGGVRSVKIRFGMVSELVARILKEEKVGGVA